MNKRALTKALKDWLGPYHGDGSVARTIAALYVHETHVPRKLREPLRKLAMTCLACEITESAPTGAPSFPELYRSREKALEAFADAVAAPRKLKSANQRKKYPTVAPIVEPEWNAARELRDECSVESLYPSTKLPCDAEGIMHHDRTREPEES